MDNEHWFDALNKSLIRAAPRRILLGAAGALAASLALGGPVAEAAKRRKKKKRKKKGKGKGRPRRCGPDAHAACEIAFSPPLHTPQDTQFCKDKCESCRAAGIDFCIHKPDDDNHATCCPRGEVCCGGLGSECCIPEECCEVAGTIGRSCVEPGGTCCPSEPSGFCEFGATCCPGQGCFACNAPYVINPDTCECECPDGQIETDGECVTGTECPDGFCSPNCIGPGFQCCGQSCACVNTLDNPNHCGGCDQPCRDPGRRCCDGNCVDVRFNNDHCGGGCLPCPSGTECCHGQCLDPQQLRCCRDGLPTAPWCAASTSCCTNSAGEPACCV
jgi:hypothetical protein